MRKKRTLADEFWKRIYPTKKNSRKIAEELRRRFHWRTQHFPVPTTLWTEFFAETAGSYIHRSLSSYLLEKQSGYCCYCQERIFTKVNAAIDHILPRSFYPQFTFTFHNLALACVTCNGLKSNENWYQLPFAELKYSKHRKAFQVFHPKFHEFNEHVDMLCMQTNYIYVRTYFGRTDEGRELCLQHLNKIAVYAVKSKANTQAVKAIEDLGKFISTADTSTDASERIFKLLVNRLA